MEGRCLLGLRNPIQLQEMGGEAATELKEALWPPDNRAGESSGKRGEHNTASNLWYNSEQESFQK